ncbi:MAG: hypothetical protein HQL47_00240 [Gammaproteobacteria bacterium]|nr:hypothetical protein [Gammaproteobacteria bacterium]
MATETQHPAFHCLKQALLKDSGPTLFLFAICLLLGSAFLYLGAEMGMALILIGTSALGVFLLLGMRGNCSER